MHSITSWCIKQWSVLWLLCALYVIGLVLFWKGFFGSSNALTGFSDPHAVKFPFDLCGIPPTSLPDPREDRPPLKIVFILIDALRYDFVTFPQLRFLNSLLSTGSALLYRSRAYSPTVTLPRIKTLISGTVPGFADLLVNFNAQALRDDNLVHQAYASGKKVVFYGDNTWLKILPHHFHRYEGTTSFFVSDYTEVDINVTRHVPSEMEASDWDFLILHYLGLDHIGHAHGPTSPLIGRKLSEMDDVIKIIYEGLKKRKPERFLIVITGDHGMSSTGNHGGVSENEVMTPLVLIPTEPWTWASKHTTDTISQLDIVATLSLLTGLPIPKCSYGVAIAEALIAANYSNAERLFLMQYNLQHVLLTYQNEYGAKDDLSSQAKASLCYYLNQSILNYFEKSLKASDHLEHEFYTIMTQMRDALLLRNTAFDMNLVLSGISLSWLSSLTLLLAMFATSQKRLCVPEVTAASLILGVIVSMSQHWLLCLLCPSAQSCKDSAFLLMLIPLTTLAAFLFCAFLHWPFLSRSTGVTAHRMMSFVTVSHALSLASTSFVEEEHLTWYFFTTTIIVILLVLNLPNQNVWPLVGRACCVMLLSRILRSWNSTGDKWAHLPDTADWLADKSHKPVLAVLMLAGVVAVILLSLRRDRPLYSFFFYLALLDICFYKLKFLFYEDSSGVENLYWYIPLLVSLGLFHRFQHGLRNEVVTAVADSWSLLSFILHSPQNTPMFALVIVLEKSLNNFLSCIQITVPMQAVVYFWFGMSSHFYQGNSNSLSTVSVAAGYIGVSNYSPIVVGLLMFCHTYSGMVHWLLMLWKRFAEHTKGIPSSSSFRAKIAVCSLLILLKFATTAWYLVLMVVQRYHIFVQSVFSPKLIYESAHAVTILLVTIISVITLL